MKTRILNSSLVIDFIDIDFNSDEIKAVVKSETDEVAKSIKNEILKDWEVKFVFTYNYVKQILIYSKNRSHPVEKYKEVVIHIPIPTIDKAPWGVKKEQHIYKADDHLDKIIKNFDYLDVNFKNYTNRTDYILDCMRRSIKFCFEKGFTINGVKVKV